MYLQFHLWQDCLLLSCLEYSDVKSCWIAMMCVKSDSKVGVPTLPVQHGCAYSSKVALCTTICMSIIAVSQPLWQVLQLCTNTTSSLWNVLKSLSCRRLGLALTASISMLQRSWQVYQTRGKDLGINSTVVDESLMTVVFLLASFV